MVAKRMFKKRAYKKRAARPKAPATKQAITKLVKQVIAREDETKFRSETIELSVGHNSQITTGDFIRALPKLVQDQGEGAIYERLGRKITVRKAYLDLDICLNDLTRSSALVVHVWILTMKQFKDLANLTEINNRVSQFLVTGDSSEYQQFNGYAEDAMLPVNQQQFNVMKKYTFLLGKNTGTIQDDTTAGNQPLAQAVRRHIRVPLTCPKVWLYEQDNNSPRTQYYPKNFAPFYAVSYHHQNQTAPDVLNLDVSVTSRASIWFDDA